VWTTSPETLRPLNSFLILLNLEKDVLPDELVTIKFWLGMRHDIQQLADNCHICQATKPGNQLDHLYQHEEGSRPCEKGVVDKCEFSGKPYLITVDYFSKFIEVDLLTNTSAKQVILCLKRHFARYGFHVCILTMSNCSCVGLLLLLSSCSHAA